MNPYLALLEHELRHGTIWTQNPIWLVEGGSKDGRHEEG